MMVCITKSHQGLRIQLLQLTALEGNVPLFLNVSGDGVDLLCLWLDYIRMEPEDKQIWLDIYKHVGKSLSVVVFFFFDSIILKANINSIINVRNALVSDFASVSCDSVYDDDYNISFDNQSIVDHLLVFINNDN